jgi:UDP-N-acetylglucosamine 1-carboxyvinyltransferase
MKNNVEKFRKKRGWSQRDLARDTGLSNQTINNIEIGKADPKLSTLVKIGKALKQPVSELFPGLKK